MKLNITYVFVVASMLLCACGHDKGEQLTMTAVDLDDLNLIQVNLADVSNHEKVNLSDLVEGLEVIRMDNSNEALFKSSWAFFSDKYIVVKDALQGRPAKIFDKKGRYIAPIGGIGRGPGEYNDAYDILIDESSNSIYLTQLSARSVNQYDLNGNFVKEIKLGTSLYKPRLFNNGDSTISIVNMGFYDVRNPFVAATINPFTDEIVLLQNVDLCTNFENKEGSVVGFDNEVFSYRNTSGHSFKYSFNEKLLKYDPTNQSIFSVFELTLPENMKEDHWCVYNELPNSILAHVVGPKGRTIKIAKEDWTAVEIELINDLFGGMDTGMSFQDGYYFKIYEPRWLKEKVAEFLRSSDVEQKDKDALLKLVNSINDDDNNILLVGKLR